MMKASPLIRYAGRTLSTGTKSHSYVWYATQRQRRDLRAWISFFSTKTDSVSDSTMPRTAITLLGAVNAGKSVLMNLLTQSDTSLVHSTAGTTADPKTCLMELHGRVGPVRLFDTPGINERGELGMLKRERALNTVGQADVAMIVVDPFSTDVSSSVRCTVDLLKEVERRQELNALAKVGANHDCEGNQNTPDQHRKPLPLLLFNLRQDKVKKLEATGGSVSLLLEEMETKIRDYMTATTGNESDPKAMPPTIAVDLTAVNPTRDRVIGFLERHAVPRLRPVSVLPDWLLEDKHSQGQSPTVFLNIPMDQQTPAMRLLRPQAMVQEALIRNFVSTFAYRMDLTMARSDNQVEQRREKDRFLRALDPLLSSGDLSLLITDSQAIDLVSPWTLDYLGREIVPITTFSVTMIRFLSGGRLSYFATGLRKLDQMVAGQASPVDGEKWRILISEACNHTRLDIDKQCADIGTVQLPLHLRSLLGQNRVEIEYAFGKHVLFDPTNFDLVVHCGGCMLTPQQMDFRVADLMAAGVPATNYGLLMARMQSPETLLRVLKPWGVELTDDVS